MGTPAGSWNFADGAATCDYEYTRQYYKDRKKEADPLKYKKGDEAEADRPPGDITTVVVLFVNATFDFMIALRAASHSAWLCTAYNVLYTRQYYKDRKKEDPLKYKKGDEAEADRPPGDINTVVVLFVNATFDFMIALRAASHSAWLCTAYNCIVIFYTLLLLVHPSCCSSE